MVEWRLNRSALASRAVQEALTRTAAALHRQGCILTDSPAPTPPPAVTLAATIDSTLARESFSIIPQTTAAGRCVTLTAADDRGLAYGFDELAAAIAASPVGRDPFLAVPLRRRAPEHPVRSVNLYLHNRQLEEEWFFSRTYWERHFALLARARFNMFTLTYGHQTAYLSPPFPFLFDVPGYERLRTPTYTPADRRRNLDMLRTISALSADWGLTFVIGIWQAHAHRFGDSLVEGLAYEDLFDYCPKALGILLAECPSIGGVQFRMNSESGIEEDDQARFFGPMFEAIARCGRPMWMDLRAKGLRAETIALARRAGLPVTVSTKFWTEHMGLPHLASRTNPADANQYRRYGYWDLLPKDRPYRLFYQLWTVGTNKVLPWGSLEYAQRFSQSCHFGDAAGFEVCAPVSNKGYGNLPGGVWHVLADRQLEYTDWEFERYWAFYLTFGLAGYAPEGDQPVLDAAFREHFGADAQAARRAYETAGGILPLITAFHSVSASTFGYWPEMDLGGLTDVYPLVPTGDVDRMQSIYEYVNGLLEHTPTGKLTPPEVADDLERLARETDAALADVKSASAESAATRRDLAIQAHLARYHAHRIRSGIGWLLFRRTADETALGDAVRGAESALHEWEAVVSLTDGVYYAHMVFIQPERQAGHWKDLLPFLRHDVERLRRVAELFSECRENPARAAQLAAPFDWYEYERKWAVENGVPRHWAGDCIPAQRPQFPEYGLPKGAVMQSPEAVVREALATRAQAPVRCPRPRAVRAERPAVRHRPIEECFSNRDLPVRATVEGAVRPRWVRLHYRRQVQSEDWNHTMMRAIGASEYEGVIPGAAIAPNWDLMYAIEVIDENDNGLFYPDQRRQAPYIVVRVNASRQEQ